MITSVLRKVSLPILIGAALVGCVPALRDPGTLPESPGVGPEGVEALLQDAEADFAKREPGNVRRAARSWLRAAGADQTRVEGLIGASRAGIWLANHESQSKARRDAAVAAVRAGQWCQQAQPDMAACDYWLALALGVQARERRTTALDALPTIVELLEGAAEREPTLEQAGPFRALALILTRAPGWPTGPGDPEVGLEHAERAVELAPDYPPNQLALGEVLLALDEEDLGRETLERARQLARAWVDGGDPDAPGWLEQAAELLR